MVSRLGKTTFFNYNDDKENKSHQTLHSDAFDKELTQSSKKSKLYKSNLLSKPKNILSSISSNSLYLSQIRLSQLFIFFENDNHKYSLKLSLSSPFSFLLAQIEKMKPSLFINHSFFLMKNHIIIENTSETIEDSGICDDDTIYVVLTEKIENEDSDIIIKKKNLAPINALPKLTKKSYSIFPSLIEIYRMTLDELRKVDNFSIYNEHGRIDFEEPVDLEEVDLDEIVIEKGSVSVYSNSIFKPLIGEKLNKKATVYLYNLYPNKENENEFLRRLQKKCNEINGNFKGYNGENGTFIFQVEHF